MTLNTTKKLQNLKLYSELAQKHQYDTVESKVKQLKKQSPQVLNLVVNPARNKVPKEQAAIQY